MLISSCDVLAFGYGARDVAASLAILRAAEGRKNFAVLVRINCKLLQTSAYYAEFLCLNCGFAKLQTSECKLVWPESPDHNWSRGVARRPRPRADWIDNNPLGSPLELW
jgi:hypothetical protein